MSEKWQHLVAQLDLLVTFLNDHQLMIGSHLNDFFCNQQIEVEDIPTFCNTCQRMAGLDCCFESTFTATCHKYCRKNVRPSPNNKDTSTNMNTFLSVKKNHEIQVFSSSIEEMVNSTGCPYVVDIGSGKGYLGQRLTEDRGCLVLGIEGSTSCSESAHNRQKQINKLNNGLSKSDRSEKRPLMKTITQEIGDATVEDSSSFVHIIKMNLDAEDVNWNCTNNSLLVGLHACGDLTAHTLKLFTKETYFRGIQIVGCCYNLCTETHLNRHLIAETDAAGPAHFPLSSYVKSKNIYLGKVARQLACQSPEKWQALEQELQPSLLYRSVLQKVVCDLNVDVDILSKVKFRKIGKRSASFVDYMTQVYKYLDANEVGLIAAMAEEYYERYSRRWEEMKIFHWLRMQLAPCLEKLILLDRLCYLMENGLSNASVVKMFDTSLSPRCFAIVCEKE